tara:strand:+ start:825 stop:1400 length:576 start_codon:yes stop_codon:yes gene_type:complete
MQVTIGSATFNVSFGDDYDEDPYGDGTPGFDGRFEVNRQKFAKLYDGWEWKLYELQDEYGGDDALMFDPEEHDEDDTISVSNGDDFITFFNAAMLDGGTWDIKYDGNPYWFFHDVTHAQNDTHGGEVYVDPEGYAEDKALFEGATLAHENGIGLGVIFKQLAQVLKPFEERFGRPTDAIERFADSLNEVTA